MYRNWKKKKKKKKAEVPQKNPYSGSDADADIKVHLLRTQSCERFTLPHLLQDTGELVHINRGGVFLATRCPKIDGSQIQRAGGKKSVMTRALWGVTPLSCKVWHLFPWLAEHVGWGGTQSCPCSIGQLGSPEWCRVVFYHWGGYMLTHVITDLPPQQSTSWTAYPMKRSQSLRQTHLLPSLKATVKQETHLWRGSWTTTAWSRAQTPRCADVAVKWSQGNSDCMLCSLGQMKFMPSNRDQTWKVLKLKCSFTCTIQFSSRCSVQ